MDDYQVHNAGLAKGRQNHNSAVSDREDKVVNENSQKTTLSWDTDDEASPIKGRQTNFQKALQMLAVEAVHTKTKQGTQKQKHDSTLI